MGVGTALLERGLAQADTEGIPAYLEATSERNAMLYLRHGFQALSVLTVPDYPEIIAMWRPVRTTQPAPEASAEAMRAPEVFRRPGLLARLVNALRERRQHARAYRTS